MTRQEALDLLENGETLTLTQRLRIKEILSKASVYNDPTWNESNNYWHSSSDDC